MYNLIYRRMNMKKLAIVCDSSVALTEKQIKEFNIYIAPLTIVYNNKEYSDQVNITKEEVVELIRKNVPLKTSQPNLGVIIELLQKIKERDYDHIFILSLTSKLSGTYSSFQSGINEIGLGNVSLIDTQTLAGPVQESIKAIHKLNEENKDVFEIENYLNNVFFKDTASYVYPKSLEQLKQGGRISKTAAMMASMLKIKVLLKLDNHGDTIDKFKTARTEAKIVDEIIKDLILNNVNPEEHVIYLPHLEAQHLIPILSEAIKTKLGDIEIIVSELPAALSCHAGVETIAVQWSKSAKNISE